MQVTPNVLNVLDLGLRIDGCNVVIHEQLEPKLYRAVNKVLEACGGKWNRKAKAHVFDSDPTGLIEAVVDSSEVMTARDVGFFETPVELARELVDMARVRPNDVCLEPSAGTGRIVEALIEAGAKRVHAFEIDEARSVALAKRVGANLTTVLVSNWDFMEVATLDPPPQIVVMNPPFCKVGRGNHLDHVQHAFGLLSPGGLLVSVLPISVKFRTDKRHAAFRAWYEGLGGKVRDLSPEAFAESGTHVRTCVLQLQKAG